MTNRDHDDDERFRVGAPTGFHRPRWNLVWIAEILARCKRTVEEVARGLRHILRVQDLDRGPRTSCHWTKNAPDSCLECPDAMRRLIDSIYSQHRAQIQVGVRGEFPRR